MQSTCIISPIAEFGSFQQTCIINSVLRQIWLDFVISIHIKQFKDLTQLSWIMIFQSTLKAIQELDHLSHFKYVTLSVCQETKGWLIFHCNLVCSKFIKLCAISVNLICTWLIKDPSKREKKNKTKEMTWQTLWRDYINRHVHNPMYSYHIQIQIFVSLLMFYLIFHLSQFLMCFFYFSYKMTKAYQKFYSSISWYFCMFTMDTSWVQIFHSCYNYQIIKKIKLKFRIKKKSSM